MLSGDQGPLLRLHGDLPGDEANWPNVNNQGFGVCFRYKQLNLAKSNSDLSILALDLLIYSSEIIE